MLMLDDGEDGDVMGRVTEGGFKWYPVLGLEIDIEV